MALKYKYDVPIQKWLIEHLETITPLDIPTTDSIRAVGDSALQAKISHVEEYNLALPSRIQKRIPDRLDIDDMAGVLNHLLHIKNIITSPNEKTKGKMLGLYLPTDKGMWSRLSVVSSTYGTYSTDTDFYHHLTGLLATNIKERDTAEVIAKLKANVPIVELTKDTHLFPVKNGVYDQKTKHLYPHSPDYIFLSKITVDYKENLTNPIITGPDGVDWDVDTWLRSLAASDDINTLFWQIISASMQPNRGIGKSIWFYSESGNNGKGTMGQLIKNLIGPGNYSSLSVMDFGKEFYLEPLVSATANIADENDVDAYIDSVKYYKASITGDDITINRKHKETVTFQFRGLNIQMLNGLPKTKDRSDSFYRRILLVPFIKSFTNNGEKSYIKSDYIHRKDVLEYTLSKAISLEFEEFITPYESTVLLDQYREKNDPVLDYWNQFEDEFKWDLIPKGFLYDLYKKWYDSTHPGGKCLSQRSFFDSLGNVLQSRSDQWANHIGTDKSNIHTGTRMDDDEPLITEYGLDLPQRDGTPSPWVNHSYNGQSAQKKRDFVRKTKYRGILRI